MESHSWAMILHISDGISAPNGNLDPWTYSSSDAQSPPTWPWKPLPKRWSRLFELCLPFWSDSCFVLMLSKFKFDLLTLLRLKASSCNEAWVIIQPSMYFRRHTSVCPLSTHSQWSFTGSCVTRQTPANNVRKDVDRSLCLDFTFSQRSLSRVKIIDKQTWDIIHEVNDSPLMQGSALRATWPIPGILTRSRRHMSMMADNALCLREHTLVALWVLRRLK